MLIPHPHARSKQKLPLLFLFYVESLVHITASNLHIIHNQTYNGTYSASQTRGIASLPQRRTAFAITKKDMDQVRSHSHKITNTEKPSKKRAEERGDSCSEAGHHGKHPAGRFVCTHPRRADVTLTSAPSYRESKAPSIPLPHASPKPPNDDRTTCKPHPNGLQKAHYGRTH